MALRHLYVFFLLRSYSKESKFKNAQYVSIIFVEMYRVYRLYKIIYRYRKISFRHLQIKPKPNILFSSTSTIGYGDTFLIVLRVRKSNNTKVRQRTCRTLEIEGTGMLPIGKNPVPDRVKVKITKLRAYILIMRTLRKASVNSNLSDEIQCRRQR